ncbi:MAG: multiheme c-type cytochrome [Thermoleophilia bacterium]
MKKYFLPVSLLILIAVLATISFGCGNDSSTADTSGQTSGTTSTTAEAPHRGCLACHVKTPGGKDYTLPAETKNVTGHPNVDASATLDTCLQCHKTGERSFRKVLHPKHLFSDTFTGKYKGNCFSCHDVNDDGKFVVLYQKVETK